MKKKFVLSGYFGFKNFGDEAILTLLIERLRQHNAQITIITSDKQYTKDKFNDATCIYTFDIKQIINAIRDTDYLISGGGSLLQDVTSLKSLLYYIFIIFLAWIFRKKFIIFAQGIGPINSNLGKFLTRYILKKCYYISVRDSKSRDLLKKWGIEADLLSDPIFSTKVIPCEKENIVAIQLRDFRTLNNKFLSDLAKATADRFSTKEIHIYSFQDSIDVEICKTFENLIKSYKKDIKTELHTNLKEDEIVLGISKAQYLIAMRFHAIVIGLLAGVKTFAINYDIKVENLADEFNLPIISPTQDITSEFDKLETQDLKQIADKIKEKSFNWSNFESAISE